MRLVLISGAITLAALSIAPLAGASCHYCLDPVAELLRTFLP
jgi:hypothetical protein